jgi:D-lactate dehydrogenase (cytochrome)
MYLRFLHLCSKKTASLSSISASQQDFLRSLTTSAATTTCSSASPDVLSALKALLGTRLSTATSVREHHGRDESYHAVTPPDAVAFVESTEEVSEILKICSAHNTPVIPFGAGSSLEGHIAAQNGGISIDLTGLNNILSVEPENMSVRVQAGVTREQLNADLRATGLFFPVDPGANATIGGMLSTNASGTTTVRYGNMKTNVMALTVVMADGRIIKTGSK